MNPEINPSEITVEPTGETPVASVDADPKPHLFDMEKTLSQTMVNLAKTSPQNAILHGHIMRLFGIIPPPEVETYQQLRDWMETTFSEPTKDPKIHCYLSDQAKITEHVSAGGANPVMFHIRASRNVNESGRCAYSRSFSSSVTIEIRQDYLMELVDDGKSIDEIKEAICGMAEEDFGDYDPEDSDFIEDDFSDYDANDSEYEAVQIHRPGAIEGSIEDFVHANFSEDEAREILDR